MSSQEAHERFFSVHRVRVRNRLLASLNFEVFKGVLGDGPQKIPKCLIQNY